MRRTASGTARALRQITDYLRRERDLRFHDASRRQRRGDRRGASVCRREVKKIDRWLAVLSTAKVRVVMDGGT